MVSIGKKLRLSGKTDMMLCHGNFAGLWRFVRSI